MSKELSSQQICLIIGASHAGVNCAFALRKEGWSGEIILIDPDPLLPYHRPPLSKDYLTGQAESNKNLLRGELSYEKENITLSLGKKVASIHKEEKYVVLSDGSQQNYDKLVIATGARPLVPKIPGLESSSQVFTLRDAQDARKIHDAFQASQHKRVGIIGAGYIGLEAAASLKKLGAEVHIFEREERVLSRVTSPELSHFFQQLHTEKGVNILLEKTVISVEKEESYMVIRCGDETSVEVDLLLLACGILPNTDVAKKAGLEIENGISVDASARTQDPHIYAIGDCSFHHNPHYDRYIRLESVQNAADQAKVAAASIAGKEAVYHTIPWFWSNQFDIKLQMVGLSAGYNQTVLRKEESEDPSFSIWYFKNDTLLAVDAINNGKAYVLGTRFIKSGQKLNKTHLADPGIPFRPNNLLAE